MLIANYLIKLDQLDPIELFTPSNPGLIMNAKYLTPAARPYDYHTMYQK